MSLFRVFYCSSVHNLIRVAPFSFVHDFSRRPISPMIIVTSLLNPFLLYLYGVDDTFSF
jgi:hypothetical protein